MAMYYIILSVGLLAFTGIALICYTWERITKMKIKAEKEKLEKGA